LKGYPRANAKIKMVGFIPERFAKRFETYNKGAVGSMSIRRIDHPESSVST